MKDKASHRCGTLNLLDVSRCEMLHFVTSYMKQNKSRKQTLESAQYRLEISFLVAFQKVTLNYIVIQNLSMSYKTIHNLTTVLHSTT